MQKRRNLAVYESSTQLFGNPHMFVPDPVNMSKTIPPVGPLVF